VKSEVKKVKWPNRQQMISSTGAVLVILIVSGVFLGLLDVLFTNVIGSLLSFLTGGA
jgi:preprotein translocase subunit SecE